MNKDFVELYFNTVVMAEFYKALIRELDKK